MNDSYFKWLPLNNVSKLFNTKLYDDLNNIFNSFNLFLTNDKLYIMVGRALWNASIGFIQRSIDKRKYIYDKNIGISYPHIWKTRAGLLDCDINFHLNNASYLYNMELSRWHLCSYNGILGNCFKYKWMFLLGSQTIRFRYPIPPLKPYEIHSKLIYWDDKWMYLIHQFIDPETAKIYAEGFVRVMFRGKQYIPPTQVFESIGISPNKLLLPNEMPQMIHDFITYDKTVEINMKSTLNKNYKTKKINYITDSFNLSFNKRIK